MLAWLLGEPAGEVVREILAAADRVVTSDLTLVECDRALIRTQASGRLAEAAVIELRVRLNGAATGWDILRLDAEVIERARRPFPREPLRTLDALHLASALVAARVAERATLLSLDARVRVAGRELGLIVVPE